MAAVEPVHGEPAAVAELDGERALVLADYHAGVEVALRSEGVELESRAERRRERLCALVERTDADRVLVVGDLAHGIGEPGPEERAELRELLAALPVSLTLIRGNHDGDLEAALDVAVLDAEGVVFGDVGFTHGHVWPDEAVLEAGVVCAGHEHPAVRIEDEVGGSRVERAWLRGPLSTAPFEEHAGHAVAGGGELVVFPAFNDVVGGTWVNVPDQEFLSPFLPGALPEGQAYLLDGTRLGRYRSV
jgi:putative SbcD/Mre11-related phosphoesterase